ncbi:RnfABCDGE type electron transport complex subunit G [Wukongibacter sp. M2B1]|uniref:RnfABCDGE type electron transport complex subunit G n=1 Tax=Wukongibacter sp. M2B1 TaxID=3088895 RepID=UPI003D78EE0F
MKEIVKLGIILLVVCIVASVALAVTNELTKDQIAKQRELASEEARKSILPSAESFKPIDEGKLQEIISKNDKVAEVYTAYKGDSVVGYTFKTLPSGYAGTVEIMTGIGIDGKVSGVRIGNHQETPGLGANAALPYFYNQYENKGIDTEIEVTKTEPISENQIQAISGATITSKAVTSGVNMAIDTFKEISGK